MVDIQIPDEAVEAAAKHDYEVRSAAVLRDFGKALPDWADASEGTREVCRTLARAMIIAALAAWPRAFPWTFNGPLEGV